MRERSDIVNYILIIELPQWGEVLRDPAYHSLLVECCNVAVNYIYSNNENRRRQIRIGNLESFMSAINDSIESLSEIYFQVPFTHGDYEEVSEFILSLLVELYQELVYNEPGHFLANDVVNVTERQVWLKVSSMTIDKDLLVCPTSTQSTSRRH